MRVNLHKVIANTGIAGPGRRYSLWVQGCKRRCEGCLASDTWSEKGGYYQHTDEIVKSIRDSSSNIEGITFLGGEPFEQAKALSAIGMEVKMQGLSVVTFTGYTLEELREFEDEGINRLLSVTDLLIDGAFQIENKSLGRPWVGSSNQRYIFLTNRYSDEVLKAKNKLEIHIYQNGKAVVSGMGDFSVIEGYFK